MMAPIFSSGSSTTARRDLDAAIKHSHFCTRDSRHQVHFIHVAKVANTE
jgi:hypothetical protein